jgi:hypothetical protein
MSILPPAIVRALQEAELIQKHDRLCDLAAIDAIPIELLQILTLNNQISIAKQSTTAERILISLATNNNKEVRLSVFKNSDITMAVLKILSEDEDRQIRRLFKVHPSNPNRFSPNSPEQLRKLAQDKNYRIRSQVASNPATPIDVLEILADDLYNNDGSYYVRQEVSRNSSTPVNILRKLSRDLSCSFIVGYNPNTPVDILEKFIENNNRDAMRGMAKNPSTPSHTLEEILRLYPNDLSFTLLYISNNPNTLAETLSILATYTGNNGYGLRIGVANNINTLPNILANLAYDRDKRVKIAVASNPNTPSSVMRLLWESRDIFIYQALAKNPAISTDLLRNVAETDEYVIQSNFSGDDNIIKSEPISNIDYKKNLQKDIKIALCRNPQTPSDILEKLADDRGCDRVSIANHQNTPVAVLEKLSQLKASSKIRKAAQARLRSIYRELAANPETSTEQLWEMLYHRDIEIRLAVLLHPQGLNLLLDRALQVENSLNRFIAGLHPQLSAVQRDKLFYSDHWLDRLAIACNPSTSIEQLQILSQDARELIRDIANQKILD